jgi:hypothetical protein
MQFAQSYDTWNNARLRACLSEPKTAPAELSEDWPDFLFLNGISWFLPTFFYVMLNELDRKEISVIEAK